MNPAGQALLSKTPKGFFEKAFAVPARSSDNAKGLILLCRLRQRFAGPVRVLAPAGPDKSWDIAGYSKKCLIINKVLLKVLSD